LVLPIAVYEPLGSDQYRLHVDADEATLLTVQTALDAGAVGARGRGRLGSITATGASRVVADDALLLGPDGGEALDDRSFLDFDGESRILLASDQPAAVFTAVPDGGSVLVGESVQVEWTVSDPMGLVETRAVWSLTGQETVRTFTNLPTEIAHGNSPLVFEIPADAPAGAVTYSVTATDVAGRVVTSEVTWTVEANEAPTVSIATLNGDGARAGYPLVFVVDAADREGLATVGVEATGPAEPASQSVAATGQSASLQFTIQVPADADGATPVVAQAVVTDTTGEIVTSAGLPVVVTPNDLPTGTLTLADGEPSTLKPTESTTFAVHAEDPDGLASIELVLTGPVEPASQTATVTGAVEDVTFTVSVPVDAVAGPATAKAILRDRFGAVFETAEFALDVIPNASPAGSVALAAGTPALPQTGSSRAGMAPASP
ncbi:MAG: hypothetical protein AAFY88_25400, partial [Acidobacteriota bacterium]